MLNLINHDTKVCEIVINEPSTITVLNRFGIKLGVGDKSVRRVCDDHNIDPDFFVTILNTFVNKDYFPEKILDGFGAAEIVDYLSKTNAYYEHYQLPNIEHHFNLLISKSVPQNNNLDLMLRFFHEVKQQLVNRIANDRERWFPELLRGVAVGTAAVTDAEDEDTIEDKINDLISMMVMHLHGDYDTNLGVAVLLSVVSLRNDIKQNNRIRDRIMRPMHRVLAQQS